jgi:tRNA pseudouridine55 synthase
MSQKKSKKTSEFHGVLLVDKPAGMTSHDVVNRVRRIFHTRRVGHTGTLDPSATGLLALLVGEATKISEYIMGLDKTYEGTMKFGVVSDSYDTDSELRPGPGGEIPTDQEALQEMARTFTGEIDQVPPIYSAKKVDGKKLYEYARNGEEIEIKSRRIRVDDYEILSLNDDQCEFAVDCSSGTYIRSLVHDLGQKIGCGAVMSELRRTDVGPFKIEDANQISELKKIEDKEELEETLTPIQQAISQFEVVTLLPEAQPWLKQGHAIPCSMVQLPEGYIPQHEDVVVLCRLDNQAVALATVMPAPPAKPPKTMVPIAPPWFQPMKLFNVDPPESTS